MARVLALLGLRAAMAMAASGTGTARSSLRHVHASGPSLLGTGEVGSPDCAKEIEALKTREMQALAHACEKLDKFDERAVARLKAGEQEGAVNVTQQAFVKCGGLSEPCAAKVAPNVVRKLRLAGVAYTDQCKSKLKAARQNETMMKSARKCETDEKVGQNLMVALQKRDIDGSIKVAEEGYKKCMELSQVCAFQVAPVLVNRIVTMSTMRTSGMMPVFTITSGTDDHESTETLQTSLVGEILEDQQPH